MKVVWGSYHYMNALVQWLDGIVESSNPQGPYKVFEVNHATLRIYKGFNTTRNGTVEICPLQSDELDELVDHNGRLQPVKIVVFNPDMLTVAKLAARRWERRIPKALRTKESVVIERAY